MKRTVHHASGFSYVDVMIAVTILLVGVLTLGAALTGAVVTTSESEQRMRAKQYASSVLESILASPTMKIAGNAYDFDVLNYIGQPSFDTTKGKFVSGRHQLYTYPGTDGLYGTVDDSTTGGTAVEGVDVEITIADLGTDNPTNEKQITVTVYYKVKGFERSDVLSTITTRY